MSLGTHADRLTERQAVKAATLPGLATLSTPCPAAGQRGEPPLKKCLLFSPITRAILPPTEVSEQPSSWRSSASASYNCY